MFRLPLPATDEATDADLRLTDPTDVDVYLIGANRVQPRLGKLVGSILGWLQQTPEEMLAVEEEEITRRRNLQINKRRCYGRWCKMTETSNVVRGLDMRPRSCTRYATTARCYTQGQARWLTASYKIDYVAYLCDDGRRENIIGFKVCAEGGCNISGRRWQ